MVIEGPSGIGKSSAVAKAIDRLAADLGTNVLPLSARRKDDRELIAELPNIPDAGVVVIDDFHRLDAPLRIEIADYLKVLADEEREDTFRGISSRKGSGTLMSLLKPAMISHSHLRAPIVTWRRCYSMLYPNLSTKFSMT